MNINGSTGLYCLIGHPVSHSFSPLIQNALINEMGYNSAYVCFDVKPESLEESVKGLISLGVKGFNVTMPYKEKVIKYMDELSDGASYVKAVNTVHILNGRICGHNTDSEGFIRSLKTGSGRGVTGDRVLMLGAGGAAKAVAVGCLKDGCSRLYIQNRTISKAYELKEFLPEFADRIEIVSDVTDVFSFCDVIVNTTSVGMHPDTDKTPVPEELSFNSSQRVIDIIYSPEETKLLKNAKKHGAFILNGFPMLFWQGVIAFEIWNNVSVEEKTISKIMRYIYE